MYAVVMAGGGGTRLWPLSREHQPKQMHPLSGGNPLVQESVEVLRGIAGRDDVFVITNAHHAEKIRAIMPDLAGRVLIDPYRRDTAAAIGLAAVYLSRLDPDAVMGVFPADHYIGNPDVFREVVLAGAELAAEGHVVTIGIRPSCPETGYGYIETGGPFGETSAQKVRRFVEKPDKPSAEEYCESGRYLWNAGMFLWSIPTVFRLFGEHLPDTYRRLMRIRESLEGPEAERILDHEYRQMERISIDYGIMEKLDDILVITGDFGWNDIGSWATVADIAAKQGESFLPDCGLHVEIDSENCFVMGGEGRVVATIGLRDMIIVDTADALLICPKDRAQEVKKVVDALKERGLESYL